MGAVRAAAPGAGGSIGGLIGAHLLFYARVPYWHGDVAWGPRYLDFVLPLLVLPLAAGIAWLGGRAKEARRAIGAMAAVVVGAAVVVQALAVLVNFNTGFNAVSEGDRHFRPANAPLRVHARILRDRVGVWAAARFPREDGVTPEAGIAARTETDPLWPRFLPREVRLRVHAEGEGAVTGTLVYQDARERRDPPLRLVVLVNGRPAADAREAPAPDGPAPAAYRLTFTIRPAGGGVRISSSRSATRASRNSARRGCWRSRRRGAARSCRPAAARCSCPSPTTRPTVSPGS